MNQAGHIFAKDVRHLRWEIAISLALTAADVLVVPVAWKPLSASGGEVVVIGELRFLAAILSLLVGVSWWILITRMVQSESLVGDRQWWITKPYQWGQLLSAKLLFLGAFIFLPIVIAKGAVLAEGGFAPFGYLPGLGYSLVIFAAYLLVPLFAIAVITSTFARATLTTLGVVVAFIALEAVVSISVMSGFAVSWITWIVLGILLCAGFVGIGLQYARRATWTTRVILAGGLVLVSMALAVSGNSALVAMSYPQNGAPLQLSYKANSTVNGFSQSSGRKTIGIDVPVQVSGIAAGTAVDLDAMQVSAEAADGRHWKSGWVPMWGARYRAEDDPDRVPPLPVQFDGAFFREEQKNPVTLHLRFAVTELRASARTQIAMPSHEFAVPGFGICMPLDPLSPGDFTELHCRNALRQPAATFIEVQWSSEACGTGGAGASAPIQGQGWAGAMTSEPATFGINAVEDVPLDLSNRDQTVAGRTVPRHLCLGSPMTFTVYAVERRTEYDVTFANYQLPAFPPGYRVDQ